MGTFNYGPAQETAIRLVNKYGNDLIAERDGATFKSSCVFGDITDTHLPNTLQSNVDAVVFIKVSPKYTPEKGDYITAQGRTYIILDYITYQPGNTPVLYEAFLSK